jgi:hypothetical protein
MWFWLIQAIAGSILGNATASWFKNTSVGTWFYKKVEQVYNWAAQRYGLTILKSEDKWRNKYPNIAKKLDEQELRIKSLEEFFPGPDDHNAGK